MKSFLRGLEMRRRESSVKELLTNELMTTVKSLQFEFSRDDDPDPDTVNTLCTVLEAIFIHGLKETFSDRMSSMLGNPDLRPSPEFWGLLMIFSHSEVIKQITNLGQITTDVGRSRSWIRLSLNDGMIISYLIMISQDNSSIHPYYKRYAFLRDLEALEVAINLFRSLTRYSLSLPTNSTMLNSWSNTPLLLAGLWVPPMKEMPISVGTDIVQGISDDNEVVEAISISSLPSSSGKYSSEEAFLKILGTPVEGTFSDRMSSMLGNPDLILPQTYNESIEKNVEEDETSADNPSSSSVQSKTTLKEKQEKKISGTEVKDDQIVKEEKEEDNSTMESYITILDNYEINNSAMVEPNIDDIINKLSPLQNLTSSTSQDLMKSQTSVDFEFVENLSFNMNVPEFKSLVEQLGKINHERGLIHQNFCCKECGQLIGLSFSKACVCSLTGSYYCMDCFKPVEYSLPGRILHNWDFSRYSVSSKAASFLKEIHEFPLFDIRKINPRLYLVFSEMSSLQKLRLQLNFLRIYLLTCNDSAKEKVKRVLWPREYLYEHVHRYCLADLLDIPNGKLVELLKKAIKISVDHVLECQLCSQKGYICEVCKNDKAIYPFDIENTHRCSSCRTVYHLNCKKDICPKCERIKKRKDCAAIS